jgi:pimeloyl-ACP methyl ester carboxylesterase
MHPPTDKITKSSGYAPVNGLQMYYEIAGTGAPLVYIPPAFGHAGMNSFPALLPNHSVIAVDLQGHGRTADVPDRPFTLEQNAQDLVALLQHLEISQADFLGESYGGATAVLLAIHQPGLVGRVATWGATFGPPPAAHNPAMLRFDRPPTADSRSFQFQRESYRQVAPDPEYWPQIWAKVAALQWGGFSNKELAAIKAPVLIALGDHDFVRLKHALETFRRIPHAELAVIPDAGHFALVSEQAKVIPVIENFLRPPGKRIPIATAEAGYRPGETR